MGMARGWIEGRTYFYYSYSSPPFSLSHELSMGLPGKAEATRPANKHRESCPLTHHASTSTKRENCLFGLLLLGSSLLVGALLADTNKTGIGPRLAESTVSTTLDRLGEVALLDLAETGGNSLLDAKSGTDGLGGLAGLLVLGGVGSLDLVGLAGEDDQASLVGLEALDVGGEALLGEVLTAGIDGNTDGGGIELGNASSLNGEKKSQSTIPLVFFHFLNPRTLSSARVKPRPRRVRRLYLTVLKRTG